MLIIQNFSRLFFIIYIGNVYRIPKCNSHHHPAEKLSGVNAIVHRVISIFQPENIQSALYHF